jgi:tetratricopeptide (TPR) repeat protein
LADFDEAIRLCELALDLAETDDEVVDALLLMFDALLGKGEVDRATELSHRFPEGPFDNPQHTFLVGRALYEVGNLENATPLIEEAVKRSPKNAEAWYYLGLVRDERGDTQAATEAFLRSRDLDLTQPSTPVLSRETFELTAKRALAALSPMLRAYVREQEVYAADAPGVEVVVDGVDPRALLLIDAVGNEGQPSSVSARVFVYQRNVERLAGSIEQIETEIRGALEREITATFIESQRTESSSPGTLN